MFSDLYRNIKLAMQITNCLDIDVKLCEINILKPKNEANSFSVCLSS